MVPFSPGRRHDGARSHALVVVELGMTGSPRTSDVPASAASACGNTRSLSSRSGSIGGRTLGAAQPPGEKPMVVAIGEATSLPCLLGYPNCMFQRGPGKDLRRER